MPDYFDLEINTPEYQFFKGKAKSIVVETSEGKVEIMANHMPIVMGLIKSAIKLSTDEHTENIVNGKGFLQVADNRVMVFCQTAEWESEVEKNKVLKEAREKERREREHASFVEYKTNKAALSRLFEKLKVKN